MKHSVLMQVYRATWASPEGLVQVALKVLHPASGLGKDLTVQQQRELTVLQATQHANVVKLIGACLWRNQAWAPESCNIFWQTLTRGCQALAGCLAARCISDLGLVTVDQCGNQQRELWSCDGQ